MFAVPAMATCLMEKSLVFIPTPAVGHLASMVEFAKQVIHHDNSYTVTILLIKRPFAPTNYLNNFPPFCESSDGININYTVLPELTPPPLEIYNESKENHMSLYIESYKPHVSNAIQTLLHESDKSIQQASLAGIVVDMFSASMVEVANELGVPSYLYYTSGAAFLSVVFHLPAHYEHFRREFKESDPDTNIPSFVNPIPYEVIPSILLNKAGYSTFLKQGRTFRHIKGIIINTFEELEHHAIGTFVNSSSDIRLPIYPVGPILHLTGQTHGQSNQLQHDRIMTWLEAQPESSVVFLCFGSSGVLDIPQLEAVTTGILMSGYRFLWSLRKPSCPSQGKVGPPTDYTSMELQELLPREFLTALEQERGLVCGWTPQVQVLEHKAVGGFVSHCGWNSILESLWFGKPIVTWPLYAEQQINAFQMVKELRLAVELRLNYKKGTNNLVTADELMCSVRSLMDPENPVRVRVKQMSEMSRNAVRDGGSSFQTLSKLIKDMNENITRNDA